MKLHPTTQASPDLTDAAVDALKESIRAIGQQVPVVMWRNHVIDGRKRLAACEALGIQPLTITLSANAAVLDVLRAHFTRCQRADYAAAIATLTPADGPKRDRHNSCGPPSNAEAAALVGVGRDAVVLAKRLRRNGHPEVRKAALAGRITLSTAIKIVAHTPFADQPAVMAAVIADKGFRQNAHAAKIMGTAKEKRPPRKAAEQIVARAVTNALHYTEPITMLVDAPIPGTSEQRGEWRRMLTKAIRRLTRYRSRLREEGRE